MEVSDHLCALTALSWGKRPRSPLERPDGPQSWSGRGGEQKNATIARALYSGRSARGLFVTLNVCVPVYDRVLKPMCRDIHEMCCISSLLAINFTKLYEDKTDTANVSI
jgi:hypothetical protein